MSDIEAGQFLYEHREPCNQIAIIQVVYFCVAFIFTYPVWWCGLFSILVAIAGYYGSRTPVIQGKVSFVQFYYYGNWFLLFLQIISIVLLIVIVGAQSKNISGWEWTVVVLGVITLTFSLYLTYLAMTRARSYRAELMRNPPPVELMVYTQPVYTQMTGNSNGYKAPNESKPKPM